MAKTNKELGIVPDKYYTTGELMKLSSFLGSRSLFWILSRIRSGKLKAVNTSPNPAEPRYSIKGQDALDFLKTIGVVE